MCSPLLTVATIVKKYYSCGVLYEVHYLLNAHVYALYVEKSMRQEFEYIDDEPEYCDGVPYKNYLTPDDLSDAQIQTLITALHHEDDEPLYSQEEWEAKNLPTSEGKATNVFYPVSFAFEIETKQDIFGNSAEAKTTVWATYDREAKPTVQVVALPYKGVNVLELLTNALSFSKHAGELFYAIEKRAQEMYERLYQ